MKVRSSLKSLKTRHRDCKLVRRKGRVYIINKTDPRFKAKPGLRSAPSRRANSPTPGFVRRSARVLAPDRWPPPVRP